jgi:hypothetical protein
MLTVTRLGDSQMERVVHALLRHAPGQQPVDLLDDDGIGRFHGEDQLAVVMVLADAHEFQGRLDHALGAVPVTIHDAVGKRPVVRSDAHAHTELSGPPDQWRKDLLDAFQLGVVLGVAVLANGELLLVGVVARVDANLVYVLDGLHRGGRREMNVGHQRDAKTETL